MSLHSCLYIPYRQWMFIAGISLSLIAKAESSVPSPAVCPETVSAKYLQINSPDPDWQAQVARPVALSSVGFMQAPPEQLEILKPTSVRENRRHRIVEWKFEGDYPQGKWLACYYAGGAF
ncbi:MAG: hypothetical protein KGM99_08065, partial [Burkholderiales bacterium]|nr:hypothetical protein [Burkholderiales bacterium]